MSTDLPADSTAALGPMASWDDTASFNDEQEIFKLIQDGRLFVLMLFRVPLFAQQVPMYAECQYKILTLPTQLRGMITNIDSTVTQNVNKIPWEPYYGHVTGTTAQALPPGLTTSKLSLRFLSKNT